MRYHSPFRNKLKLVPGAPVILGCGVLFFLSWEHIQKQTVTRTGKAHFNDHSYVYV